ncbi:MAG TPA: isopeptide-forming domain-containing fimbrial protein [Pyrinomonadaceae bacterium]|nr:isopeptide-forming domain-containing fimbrial protein [Pyrinomonadaceae bacterium]
MQRARALSSRLLLCGLALLLLCAAAATPAQGQVIRSFTRRNPVTNERGNITLVGNSLMSCRARNNNNCASTRSGIVTGSNSDYVAEFIDADTDGATDNSSSATLTLPGGSTVLWAGLYWGARSTNATRDQIKFKPANSGFYSTLIAAQLDTTTATSNAYQGFVDVTAQVQSARSGTYWVADITANTGQDTTGFYAGWSLVVVYRDVNQPLRNLTVFDGFASVSSGNNVTTTASGLLTPTSGIFNAFAGMVTYEGDQGINGDSFQITNTSTNVTTTISDTQNPPNNFFNSSISNSGTRITAKNPDYANQLGFDVDTVSIASANTVLGNGATSVRLTFNSTQDLYYPGVLTFAVDVFRPQVDGNITKTVTDLNGGSVNPGDVIEYTITVSNTGNDGASNNILRDTIPANTTYEAGSMQITAGANTGVKTDGAGDDQAEFDGTRVVFRLGTGANSSGGGLINPGESTTLKFRVKVVAGTANGTVIPNQAVVTYNASTLGDAFTSNSDSDPNVAGTQTTNVTVVVPPVPSVKLVKDCTSPANCLSAQQQPGTDLTYTITFTNDGNVAVHNLTIVDIIPVTDTGSAIVRSTDFKVGSMTFTPGTSGMTIAPADYKYYNDALAAYPLLPPWTPTSSYTPVGAYDPNVTYVAWKLTGNLPVGTSGSVSFTVRIR